jgi:hypothetical protein
MSYELWDTETRNLIETFESRDEALTAERQLNAVNASVYPAALALVFEDEHGETSFICTGSALEEMSLSSPQAE